jgi:AcrR family transcriptional regulator
MLDSSLRPMDGSGVVRRPPFGANPLVGERGSDTQRRILNAALEVFGEVGYNDARVELITKRAGCSRPAFYQYFSSKDDVFWKLAGQLAHEMIDLGDQLGAISGDAAGVTALAAWIDDFTGLHEAYAPVFSAYQAASREHREMVAGSSGAADRLGKALLLGFGWDERDKAGTALAGGVVACLIRCAFYWETLPDAVERDRLTRGVAEVVHRLFVGPIDGVNVHRGKARPGTGNAPSLPPMADDTRALRPRGEKTRQQLLDAGAKVLPARGYHDARVDDIVQVAGVSHGSFYRYFENKDDFFRVLAEEAATQMIELLDRFPADGETDKLSAWLDEWFTTYQSNGGVISTWQEMSFLASPDVVSFSQTVAATVVARLVELMEERGFGDALVDALFLLAVVERMPYNVFTLRFASRAAATDATIAMVQRGLLGQATAR